MPLCNPVLELAIPLPQRRHRVGSPAMALRLASVGGAVDHLHRRGVGPVRLLAVGEPQEARNASPRLAECPERQHTLLVAEPPAAAAAEVGLRRQGCEPRHGDLPVVNVWGARAKMLFLLPRLLGLALGL